MLQPCQADAHTSSAVLPLGRTVAKSTVSVDQCCPQAKTSRKKQCSGHSDNLLSGALDIEACSLPSTSVTITCHNTVQHPKTSAAWSLTHAHQGLLHPLILQLPPCAFHLEHSVHSTLTSQDPQVCLKTNCVLQLTACIHRSGDWVFLLCKDYTNLALRSCHK